MAEIWTEDANWSDDGRAGAYVSGSSGTGAPETGTDAEKSSDHAVFHDEEGNEYRFNMDTLAAMQEAEDIRSGRIQAKVYHSFDEIMRDLDAD